MSVLRGQVFGRDFVQIVASIVNGVCPKQTASTPEMDGRKHDAIAGGHIFRGQEALG